MKTYEHNGHNVRLIDQRPKGQLIQINVYNPADSGHSYCTFINTTQATDETPGTPEDLDVVFDALVAAGAVDDLINKAQPAFAAASPV